MYFSRKKTNENLLFPHCFLHLSRGLHDVHGVYKNPRGIHEVHEVHPLYHVVMQCMVQVRIIRYGSSSHHFFDNFDSFFFSHHFDHFSPTSVYRTWGSIDKRGTGERAIRDCTSPDMLQAGGATPALTAIVGSKTASQLIAASGGLAKLSQQTDAQLRHLGHDALLPEFPVLRHLHAGFLAFCPFIVGLFGDDLDRDDHKTVAKAIELTGRKALMAAKLDVSGGSSSGDKVAALLSELEAAVAKASAKGKSSLDDDKALPLPEIHMAGGGDNPRRGGRKVQAKRLLEAPSTLEKAQAYVQMGVAFDDQAHAVYNLREVRAEMEQQRRLQAKKALLLAAAGAAGGKGGNGTKRSREEEEYQDLLRISL